MISAAPAGPALWKQRVVIIYNQFRNIYSISTFMVFRRYAIVSRTVFNQWSFRRWRRDVWSFMTSLGCCSVRDPSLIPPASCSRTPRGLSNGRCPSLLHAHSPRYHRQPSQTVANAAQPTISLFFVVPAPPPNPLLVAVTDCITEICGGAVTHAVYAKSQRSRLGLMFCDLAGSQLMDTSYETL